jgi:hypothetical protein
MDTAVSKLDAPHPKAILLAGWTGEAMKTKPLIH